MWASIIYVIPSEIYQWYQDNKDLENLQIAVYVMIPLGYFIILIESEVCGEMQYLKNLGDVSNSASVVRQMRSKRPLITFHVQCYHYETRYRTVYTTKTDSQGRSHTETRQESYQERVNTHRASSVYKFDHFEDVSNDKLDGVRTEGVTRIHLLKGNILQIQISCNFFRIDQRQSN